MVRCSPFAALALVAACSPLSEDVDGSRLDEGETFLVPAGERWEIAALGLDSASVGAVILKLDGITSLTHWPALNGRRVDFQHRVELAAGQRVEIGGGSSTEADAYGVLRPAHEPAADATTQANALPSIRGWDAAHATRVVRADTRELARASAWRLAGVGYIEGPPEDEMLWAFWDDGLVVFRVDSEDGADEFEVGRVSRERVGELARRWQWFVVASPDGASRFHGIHDARHAVAVRGDLQLFARSFSDRAWRDWITSDRQPHEAAADSTEPLADMHAAVYRAARDGPMSELPTLTLDGSEHPAFDDDEPAICAKR